MEIEFVADVHLSRCSGSSMVNGRGSRGLLGWRWKFRSTPSSSAIGEISEEPSPRRVNPGSDDRFRDFMPKRSYSFGFERSIASERMLVMEPATTSLRRYR
ncbi:hypothetical protein CRG98_028211 [Punica granatum]|uniref:Uncharacterized protein n=1 Tax=Punica granatum TaxID=22663 RepID=A0A2I0J599_PUNGR|nr:hypothetical protein CRG98_028211 [Punica granatum]